MILNYKVCMQGTYHQYCFTGCLLYEREGWNNIYCCC